MLVNGAWLGRRVGARRAQRRRRTSTQVRLPAAPGVTAYGLLWDSDWERPQPSVDGPAAGPVAVPAASLRVYAAARDGTPRDGRRSTSSPGRPT